MGLLKNALWIVLVAALGYAIYLFLPVVTTRAEISKEVREKLEYSSRNMRGKKLTQSVTDKLQTISVPGELQVESVQVANNNGKMTLAFDYVQHVIVKLPNGKQYVLARFPHHILIEDLPLRGN